MSRSLKPKSKSKPQLNVEGVKKKNKTPELSLPKVSRKRAPLQEGKSPNTLAYIVPPIFLVIVFGLCMTDFFGRAQTDSTAPTGASKSAAAPATAAAKKLTIPADVNNDLTPYTWASDQMNFLTSANAKVSQSGGSKNYLATNAIDGSLNNDAKLAHARPTERSAWWMAEFINGTTTGAISSIVIYGGGSASPIGKLKGGFEVLVEAADGQSYSRTFCEEGFALEGYEEWKLDAPTKLRSIIISPLKSRNSLVLREVQAIGSK